MAVSSCCVFIIFEIGKLTIGQIAPTTCGSIHSSFCSKTLKQGAKCVQATYEVLRALESCCLPSSLLPSVLPMSLLSHSPFPVRPSLAAFECSMCVSSWRSVQLPSAPSQHLRPVEQRHSFFRAQIRQPGNLLNSLFKKSDLVCQGTEVFTACQSVPTWSPPECLVVPKTDGQEVTSIVPYKLSSQCS